MMWGLQLIVIVCCMAGSGFFSGIETGIISIHRMRLEHFVRQKVRGASSLQKLLTDPDRLLGTTLVGTNVFLIVTSIMSASLAVALLGPWGKTISTVVVTIIVLVFCEFLPKAWFHSRPFERCRRFVGLLRIGELVFLPISATLIWLTRWLVPGPSRTFSDPAPFLTKEDIKVLAREGEKDGVFSSRERFMIHRVFELSGKQACRIMIPLDQMTKVDSDTYMPGFYQVARESGFTRMPVYDRRNNRFTGIINVFHVLSVRAEGAGEQVRNFARPPLFVPENMPVDDILPRMRGFRQPMCLVVNDSDVVTGLLTTEDILEEIVGKL